MPADNSTPIAKPDKPTPDFPLFPHANQKWAKKIKGKLHYFGKWANPEAALREYQDFLAGKRRKPARSRRPGANPDRPDKPYPDFPLFAHANGSWCKKIRGKHVAFGGWADPEAALKAYNRQKEDLHAGRRPREVSKGVEVRHVLNEFYNAKKDLVESGELSPRTLRDYEAVTDLVSEAFDKNRMAADLGPDDFAELRKRMTAKGWGTLRLRDYIQRVRCVFKFAHEARLIATPMIFGPGFARPTRKAMRLERAKKGTRMFEAAEIRQMLDAAGQPLKAMILLGINCGFGNADCGRLPMDALDLAGGWVNYPREKTGIPRRCPLWKETVAALKESLDCRPTPMDGDLAGRVFITRRGGAWHKAAVDDSPVSKEMRKLLDSLGIYGARNFYCLRHTLETIGGEAKDQIALDHLQGHAREDVASVFYRERISDERLKAVTDYVRSWLFRKTERRASAKARRRVGAKPGRRASA